MTFLVIVSGAGRRVKMVNSLAYREEEKGLHESKVERRILSLSGENIPGQQPPRANVPLSKALDAKA